MDVLSQLQRSGGNVAAAHGAHSVVILGPPGTGTPLLKLPFCFVSCHHCQATSKDHCLLKKYLGIRPVLNVSLCLVIQDIEHGAWAFNIHNCCNQLSSAAGKTTLLRDMASILSDKLNKYVMVIDSNNEIGGNGSVSHQSLGKARRMSVHDHARKHEAMLQAANNHKPEVRLLC